MSNRPCLLVADDDPADVFLLRRAFRRAGLACDIVDVRDGEQAIDYLNGKPPFDDRALYSFPSLLILDVKMPKMNGFDVLAWLRGRPHVEHLPVVVFSGSALESDAEMALHLGAREYLTKPADIEHMGTLVQGLYERWLTPVLPAPEVLASLPHPFTDTPVLVGN